MILCNTPHIFSTHSFKEFCMKRDIKDLNLWNKVDGNMDKYLLQGGEFNAKMKYLYEFSKDSPRDSQ